MNSQPSLRNHLVRVDNSGGKRNSSESRGRLRGFTSSMSITSHWSSPEPTGELKDGTGARRRHRDKNHPRLRVIALVRSLGILHLYSCDISRNS
ncbi:hypothetical protein HanPSC8_Chr17g0781411 [Helianthus annuus]|nr:hypothetical protein HanPSC8_Chr17g0781411 [Helianthus annuus]